MMMMTMFIIIFNNTTKKIKKQRVRTHPSLGSVFQLCANIIKFNFHLLFLLLNPASRDHRITITI